MQVKPSNRALAIRFVGTAFWLAASAQLACAQLYFTEVMHMPRGTDALWEWVEVWNTSSSAVNLDGYVFDDDDDGNINAMVGANIRASNGNTIVPAGGVAVLYPAAQLDFTPSRFTDPWGGGINLIPVTNFTALTATDAIGLWPSYEAYLGDAIPGAMSSPRRTFASAVAVLDYSTDFPTPGNGRSIAWKGTGSVASGENWVVSTAGAGGSPGPYQEVVSVATTIPAAPVNNVADFANPGIKPSSPAAAGLYITEIMFAPASPSTAGWSSTDFEWIEVLNNTAATIDFAAKHHTFDDHTGTTAMPNVTSGSIGVGQVGVLFNAAKLTVDHMATIWGPGNYIPVASWPQLNNTGGDTIAIWDDHNAYSNEEIDEEDHRATDSAIAAVTYNTVAGQGLGWPTLVAGRSIYMKDLNANPNLGPSWTRTGAVADTIGSYNAMPLILEGVADHVGDDIGSPGTVPAVAPGELTGDYNNDGRVDAADYTVWRNNLGAAGSTLHNRDSANIGSVGTGDYDSWKARYGDSAFGSGGLAGGVFVPEPTSVLMLAVVAMVAAARRRRKE